MRRSRQIALIGAGGTPTFTLTLEEFAGDGYNYSANVYVEYALNGGTTWTTITSLATPIELYDVFSVRFRGYMAQNYCIDIWNEYLGFIANWSGSGWEYTDWLNMESDTTYLLAAYLF